MNLKAYRTWQALILAGLGVFLLLLIFDGRVLLYINRRFVVLVLAGGLGLLILAQEAFRGRISLAREKDDAEDIAHSHPGGDGQGGHDHHHDHDHTYSGTGLWLLALPLLIGLLIPSRALGSTAAATRGVSTDASIAASSNVAVDIAGLPYDQWTVLDWIRATNDESSRASLTGQPANVTGFIYRDPRLTDGQFMVARFTLTCCVADAAAIAMVVDWPQAAELPENQWVLVSGPVSLSQLEGKTVPTIQAERVEKIQTPDQPYLYP